MVNLRADTRESIAKLTLMDDIFMNKVFENDTERTALLLRIILNNDKIKVVKAVTQQKLKNMSGHDLQLDILAQEENGKLFNVEVQNHSSGAAARRARYHLSLLDAHSLPKGEVYQKLPDNYVIFITQYDVLKGGLPIYHYRGPCFCHSRAALPLFRRRGQQKCCLYEEHYRKPEYHHQGTAAQRRPCACYRYGAQRRHASAPANRHRAYY